MPGRRRPSVGRASRRGCAVSIERAILEGARALTSQLLDLVSVERARELLDEEAVRRANIAADVAELAKFGPDGKLR
jgi:hypothetical protein